MKKSYQTNFEKSTFQSENMQKWQIGGLQGSLGYSYRDSTRTSSYRSYIDEKKKSLRNFSAKIGKNNNDEVLKVIQSNLLIHKGKVNIP